MLDQVDLARIEGRPGTCSQRKGAPPHRRSWGLRPLGHSHSQGAGATCTYNRRTCLRQGTSYLGCRQSGHNHSPVEDSGTQRTSQTLNMWSPRGRPLDRSCSQGEGASCTYSQRTCLRLGRSCLGSRQLGHNRIPVQDIYSQRRSAKLNKLSPLEKPLDHSCSRVGRRERIQRL